MYLDDIAIRSANEEQHEKDVRRVLAKLRQHGIYLKAKKCEWFVSQMEFLRTLSINPGAASTTGQSEGHTVVARTNLNDRGAVDFGAGVILQEICISIRSSSQPPDRFDEERHALEMGYMRCEHAFNDIEEAPE